jgi:hypothetical protein
MPESSRVLAIRKVSRTCAVTTDSAGRNSPENSLTIPQEDIPMSIDRIVLAFAGTMILASLVLANFFGPYWLLLAAFVGLNLFQAAFTGFCPMAMILKKVGVRPGAAFH